ncbi:MAG TPA: lysophospholipid acyltransferase family protein [Longimicrobiales bacterium]|nr:lysophospholipid acyltransferase family protein [Longimicrobiales bacterium]
MKRGARYAVGGALGYATLSALLATVRYEFIGRERRTSLLASGQPAVHVCWHGRLLPLAHCHRDEGMATLISQSGDGEYIARVVRRWGYVPVRGSSSRGGRQGLVELAGQIQQGRSVAITPDGPRGPKQQMKLGGLVLAQRAGVPILPVAAAADRAWWFESWDRFLVPKPFARVRVVYGEPSTVPAGADADELERLRTRVEAQLNRLTEELDGAQG